MKQAIPNSVDDYISGFPATTIQLLERVRSAIKEAAPDADETIKYAMPAYVLNGNLVYFAAYKNHIGFYPVPKGDDQLRQEISAYKTGKGSIQFPLDKDIPVALIKKMVKLRIEENLRRNKT